MLDKPKSLAPLLLTSPGGIRILHESSIAVADMKFVHSSTENESESENSPLPRSVGQETYFQIHLPLFVFDFLAMMRMLFGNKAKLLPTELHDTHWTFSMRKLIPATLSTKRPDPSSSWPTV